MSAQDDTLPSDPIRPPKRISETVAEFYRQLAATASALNAASDELGKSITAIDAALKKLNLGITTWMPIGGHETADGSHETHFLGYAKVRGVWGIALSVQTGHNSMPDPVTDENWLFNDAPRALRVSGVEHLHKLFKRLIEDAEETTSKIQQQTQRAQNIAKAVSDAATELAQAAKKGGSR
jgi:prefoldin subunit 5